MEILNWLELIKWAVAAVIAPVVGWAGLLFSRRNAAKRRKKVLIGYLTGLPPEVKAELVDFYRQGAHTKRGNPCDPVIELMAAERILKIGPGAGGYAAVNRYLTIRPEIWEVMDDWTGVDIEAYELFLDAVEQATQQAAEDREWREVMPE